MKEIFKPINIPFHPKFPDVFVKPYTSGTEKTSLEIRTVLPDMNDSHFNAVCELMEVPKEFSEDLKLAYLYKMREVSLGSDLEIKWKCPQCKRPVESRIFLENLLEFSEFEPEEKSWTLDEIDLIQNGKPTEIIEKFSKVENFKTLPEIFHFASQKKQDLPRLKNFLSCDCLFCGAENKIKIRDKQFCLDSLSERNVQTLYQAYFFLVQNGFSKSDVDSMFPFEREIQLSFVDEKIRKSKEDVEEWKKSLKG